MQFRRPDGAATRSVFPRARLIRRREVWELGRGRGYRKESLPGASPWISAGLAWRRCSKFGTCFENVGRSGAVRGRMAKSQRQTVAPFSPLSGQTNRSTCIAVCVRVHRVSLRTRTRVDTHRHQRASARVASDARTAGIRGICKIPAAHIATNCCSADRARLSPSSRPARLKTFNLFQPVVYDAPARNGRDTHSPSPPVSDGCE